jgi:hypothetical protein
MAELTEKDIDQISSDIDQQGLTYVDLKNEILDHVCCQIEVEMEKGMLFNEAYRKVRSEMGKKRILQIQDATLNLINKKYRRMKRTMLILGVISPILVIFASLLKIFHLPGGGILITLALFVTGMIFLPLYVMNRIRDTRRLNEYMPMNLYISGMIFGMITILGGLFKIQHLPGAAVMLATGLIGMAVVFLPIYARVKLKEARENKKEINKSMIIGGVISGSLLIIGALFKILHWPGAGIVIIVSWSSVAIFFVPYLVLYQLKRSENQANTFLGILLVSTSVAIIIMALLRSSSGEITNGYIIPDRVMDRSESYYEQKGKLLLSAIPETSEEKEALNMLSAKSDALCSYANFLSIEMLKEMEKDESSFINESGNVDLRKVSNKNAMNIGYELVINKEGDKLRLMVGEFKESCLSLTTDPVLKEYINAAFTPIGAEDEDDLQLDWTQEYFWGPYIHAETMVSMIKAEVRMIEYEVLLEHANSNIGSEL